MTSVGLSLYKIFKIIFFLFTSLSTCAHSNLFNFINISYCSHSCTHIINLNSLNHFLKATHFARLNKMILQAATITVCTVYCVPVVEIFFKIYSTRQIIRMYVVNNVVLSIIRWGQRCHSG